MISALAAGLFLSWFQVEGLRRSASKFLKAQASPNWGLSFGLRWGAIALMFWAGLHFFKENLGAFVISFIVCGFILRAWYGRNAYAE